MRALILAAGRGERMRPLTDATPKPLLKAGGRRLIEWQIDALARAGARDLVINTAHLPQQFEDVLGDGARYGVRLAYSREGERAEEALETLGGIVRALPRLGADAFIVVSGDIVTDYDYAALAQRARAIDDGMVDAHLVLVDNPPFHPRGDMGLAGGLVDPDGVPRLTYANIGVTEPHHSISHHGNRPQAIEAHATVNTYHVTLFAKFIERLRSAPDGEGSLLDQSLIMYGSGMGNGNVHSADLLPTLVVGRAAGAVQGGRHIVGGTLTPNADLLISIAEKLDVGLERFGGNKGRIPL